MGAAVIVDAIALPEVSNGKLRDWHPVDLASEVLAALVERNDLDPALVEDVMMECALEVGEQGANVGRCAALAAGFPESVVGTTIDRQCGSSQQAAHFAAQGVMAGAYDVVIAAGVESMTRVPLGSSVKNGPGKAFGEKMLHRYAAQGGLVNQGISAEMIAEKWDLSRNALDAFSVESHQRAGRASDQGRFENEIIPIVSKSDSGIHNRDEGIRPDCNLESLSMLQPAYRPGGRITAGNSSQITDGAAAVLIMSEQAASRLGLRPRARFHSFALAGVDPVMMLTGPIPATAKALERAGMTIGDLDAG